MNRRNAPPSSPFSRREFLRAGAIFTGLGLLGETGLALAKSIMLPFANGERRLAAYPQKRPLMVMTSWPVQLETPMSVFDEGVFTPNDAFFVRWHLEDVPTSIDTRAFRLKVHGRVHQELALTLDDLKTKYDAVEVAAVCECSGNSRGLFEPRVPGGQWANGAMGNALWKGVRLKDILEKAGLEDDAVQVRFNGLDHADEDTAPDFRKSLDVGQAMDGEVIVAYQMNGADLPLLNGFPIRLVVPGYFSTYWVKMLADIEVLNAVDDNFWMKTAYRIPDNACGCVPAGTKPAKSIPINRLTVRSFITNLEEGAPLQVGKSNTIRGIAFDSGSGIAKVLVSVDGGASWQTAQLGKDYGNYSFRQWQVAFTPPRAGEYVLLAMAVNNLGESQRDTPRWNPGGYLRNVLEPMRVQAK